MNSAGKSNSSSPAEEEIIQTSNTTVIDENEDFVLANEILVTDADDEFEKIWKDTMEEDQKSLIKLKESQSFVDLPHALGSLPSYLVASKVSRAPKSPSSLSLGLYEYSDDKLDYLKKQVLHLSNQARESNEKAFRLTKIIDQFRQSSYDVRRELRASELKISEQDGKIKVLRQKLKSLSDKIEQVSKLESRVAYLSKLNDGFSRDNKTKDESIQKLTIENRRLRSEIEAKKKIIEAAKNEKAALKKSSESFQRHKQTFEVELDSRDVQIDILRAKISKLELENVRISNYELFRTFSLSQQTIFSSPSSRMN